MYPHKDLCQTTNKGAQTSAQCASKNSLKKVLRPQEVLFLTKR